MQKIRYPELLGEMARRGDKQQDLAKLLDLTPQSVCRKFKGKSEWSISEIEKLCEHYNKDYYELFRKEII